MYGRLTNPQNTMAKALQAELIAGSAAHLGEGPVWDPRSRVLVWVDILGRRILRTSPATGATTSIATPKPVGMVALGSNGYLAGLPDGIYRVGTWARLAVLPRTEPSTRANDGKPDPWGNLLQGTMGWHEEEGAGSLYRISPAGTVSPLLSGVTISNGIDWSADGYTMYHIDTPTRRVKAYRYRPEEPLLENRPALDLASLHGLPDGMTTDVEGCLWVAFWNSGCVRRITPDGSVDVEIEVPAERVTSCTFGGSDYRTLFITTAAKEAEDPQDLGGSLFAVTTPTSGKPANIFAGPM